MVGATGGTSKILKDFSGWTSAHGIPHIGAAENWCLKMFWTIIFVTSTCLFIWQMSELIKKYLLYDVTVQTELLFKEREFPAVTVCNLNPFTYKTIRNKSTTNPPADQDIKLIYDMMQYYEWKINVSNMPNNSVTPPPPTHLTINGNYGFDELNDTIAVQSLARERLLYQAAQLKKEVRQTIAYAHSEFVVNCAYNTRPCKTATDADASVSDFHMEEDPVYGNCFTFNHNEDKHEVYKSTRAGPLYGLRLLVKSPQDDYLPTTESAGVRVAIHGQSDQPFPDAFGYNAAAGFTTSFGVTYIETKRLSKPYGNCTKTKTNGNLPYYYSGNYSVEGCFRSCYQDRFTTQCGCSDPRFKRAENNTAGSCDYDTANKCRKDNGLDNSTTSTCPCPQPCGESTYGVTVSTALWPSDVYMPPDCNDPQKWPNNSKGCHEWYRENTMLIEVYYERMNYETLSESPAYTLVALISDMGGQLGLWLGISVITVVEFLSLIGLLCCYCCRGSKSVPVMPAEEEKPNVFDKMGANPNYRERPNADLPSPTPVDRK